MKHNLRLYQENAVNNIRESFQQGFKAPLLVMPTGSGKTHVFCRIAVGAANLGYRTMIVVHRSYLWQQISDKLTALGVPHGIIAPGQTQTNDYIQVTSVDTLIRRLHKVPRPNCIVFDEGHHLIKDNKWGKVVEYYQTKIIGVTATACRTNGQGLGINYGGYYDKLIQGPQLLELTPEYLAPFKLFVPEIIVDTKRLSMLGGDYNQKKLIERMAKPKIYGNVPLHYNSICPGVPAIAFCVSVKHTEYVADEFRAHGIEAAAVSGKTPEKQRTRLFQDLARGRYKILCSCDLVSEGFDVPVCGAAICLRPSASTALVLQQWGRTTRKAPGKEFAYIIDHVGNCIKHGLPDQNRTWSLEGAVNTKKRLEEPDVKTQLCPKCFIVHAPSPICPNCGHIYTSLMTLPKSDEQIKLQEIETARQQKEAAKMEKIKAREKFQRIKNKCNSLEKLYELAKYKKYNPKWADYIWESRKKMLKNAKNQAEYNKAAYLLGINVNQGVEV